MTLSRCCRAAMTVGGDNDEGTHYYVCGKCNEPCDQYVPTSRERLENIFPLNTFRGETKRQLVEFVLGEIAETEKAYGGCHNCYGKGYATVSDRWLSSDTDQDIGSPGGTFSGGEDFAMKFCSCDRGKQLETQMDRQLDRHQTDEPSEEK